MSEAATPQSHLQPGWQAARGGRSARVTPMQQEAESWQGQSIWQWRHRQALCWPCLHLWTRQPLPALLQARPQLAPHTIPCGQTSSGQRRRGGPSLLRGGGSCGSGQTCWHCGTSMLQSWAWALLQ